MNDTKAAMEELSSTIPRLEAIAQKRYGDLPYHNIVHAKRVGEIARDMARQCNQDGMPANETVMYIAGLFHDIDFQVSPGIGGWLTHENMAAHVTYELLREEGWEGYEAYKVSAAIQATNPKRDAIETEQKILRVADMHNVWGPYEGFLKATMALKKEEEILDDNYPSWHETRKTVEQVIQQFTNQDIPLPESFKQGNGYYTFQVGAWKNKGRFENEPDSKLESIYNSLYPAIS